MLTSLLTLAALTIPRASLPAWDAPHPRVAVDTRPPDVHEARVFGAAYCEGKPGCRVEFQPIGRDGRKVPVFSQALSRLVPVSLAYGSFTRPGAQEVLMTLCNAQSDTCNGTTLLRREAGRWKAIYHTPDVTPRDCLKFRRFDGQDQLACRGNEFVMHGVMLHLVTADARRATQKTLLDGNLRGCGDKVAVATSLGDWRKQDVNGDGRPDLVVEVDRYTLTSAKPSCPPHDPNRVEGTRTVRRFGM